MKKALHILGSAAAEAVPGRFCNCEYCQTARRNGGKDIRFTTSYALNERVRIDMGPDAYHSELKCGLDPSKMKHLFITHEHTDHLDTFSLKMRRKGFANGFETPLHIYSRPTAWFRILHELQDTGVNLNSSAGQALASLEYHKLDIFQPVELEDEDMTFYPIPAAHYNIPDEAVFFIIRHGNSWLMIANDTGYPDERVWQWLEEKKILFEVVIFDCTMIHDPRSKTHLNTERIFDMRERLLKMGCIADSTKLTVNHFSHNYNPQHSKLEAFFNPRGIAVGYDGMIIPYGEK